MKKTTKLPKKLSTKPETIRALVNLAQVTGGALSSSGPSDACGPSYLAPCN